LGGQGQGRSTRKGRRIPGVDQGDTERAKGHQDQGSGVPGVDQGGTAEGGGGPGEDQEDDEGSQGQDQEGQVQKQGLSGEDWVIEDRGDSPHRAQLVAVEDVEDLAVDGPGPLHLPALTELF